MNLPMKPIAPVSGHPTILVIGGQAGVGKTSLTAGLNKNGHRALVFDFQGGATAVGGYVMDLKAESNKSGKPIWMELINAIQLVKVKNREVGSYYYDFLVLDPLTDFKDIVNGYGTYKYNKSLVGRSASAKRAEEALGKGIKFTDAQITKYESKDVTSDLGKNGWNFLNQAWGELLNDLCNLAPVTIFMAHTRYKTLVKSTLTEFNVKELDFWPGYTGDLVRKSSDSGMLYRDGNKTVLSFEFLEDMECFKSRWFDGQKIVLSEKTPDGKITTYMERLFPYLNKPKV